MANTIFNLTRGRLYGEEMLRMEVIFKDGEDEEPLINLFIPRKTALSMAWQILEEFEYDEKKEKKILM